MKARQWLLTGLVATALAAAAGCGESGDERPTALNMGTHPSGSMIHTIGVSLASAASKDGITVNVSPYGGPSQWLPEMQDRLIDLGIESSHGTKWAFQGEHSYENAYDFVRIVSAGVYPIYNGLLVREDSDIKTVADLAGKNIPTGFGAQIASHMLTQGILSTEGLGEGDIKSVPVASITDGIELFRDGAIDAIALPSSSPDVRDLDAGVGVRYLSISDSPQAIEKLQELVPGATVLQTKGGTPGMDKPTNLVANYFMVVGHKDLANADVTALLNAWWEYVDDLQKAHPAMRNWVRDNQVPQDPAQMTAPFHQASIEFYKDKGIWSAEHDARQEELLSR